MTKEVFGIEILINEYYYPLSGGMYSSNYYNKVKHCKIQSVKS